MRTPDWLVERIAMKALPPEALEAARRQLLDEPDGAARLAALARSDAEILAALPPDEVAAEVRRRLHEVQVRERLEPRARRMRPSPALLSGLATAALVLVVGAWLSLNGQKRGAESLPGDALGLSTDRLDETRVKGERARLHVQRREGGSAVSLENGASARAGDVLQLGYVAGDATHAVIFSIDGTGALTRHLPEHGTSSAALLGDGLQALPHAFELDAAPGFERFFMVTSEAPFDAAPVFAAAKSLGGAPSRARTATLDLPAGLHQASLLLVKELP